MCKSISYMILNSPTFVISIWSKFNLVNCLSCYIAFFIVVIIKFNNTLYFLKHFSILITSMRPMFIFVKQIIEKLYLLLTQVRTFCKHCLLYHSHKC